jgi:uncharacterized protein (TIGR03067 family)
VTRFALFAALVFTAGATSADDKTKTPEGTYSIVSLRVGAADALGDAKGATVKFDAGTMTVSIADRVYSAKVKLDATKTPVTIDIVPADGKDKGKTFPGIIEVAGAGVTIAFVEDGKRPADFKADTATVLTLKKKE